MNKEWLLTERAMLSLRQFGLHGEATSLAHVEMICQQQLAKVEPLIRADAHKEIGDYMADKKKHGHLNSLVIADLMERLQAGKSPTEESEK